MNINDEGAYDRKMEEIIVSLEVFILDDIPNQNQDDGF